MNISEKIVFTFNKFYSSFIKDVKEISGDLRVILKKHYKAINKLSTDHIEFFIANPDTPLIDISLDLLNSSTPEESKDSVQNYLNILKALACLYTDAKADPSADEATLDILFTLTLDVIKKVQSAQDPQEPLDQILHDDLREILLNLKPAAAPTSAASDSAVPGMADLFGEMGNSKICKLAQEISQEIDVNGIDIQKPEDIVKLMDFSSSNNVLGNIIQKVSTKIHDKISTGDLKQEDLLGEAMNMMNLMGGSGGAGGLASFMSNPMFADLMKNMKKNKTQVRQDAFRKADVRQRLRNKLEQKNKQG